jgi:transporter family protein
MTWLTAALASTLLFAVVSILDKRLVEHLFPSVSTFNVTFGLLQFIIAPIYFTAVVLTVGFDGGSGIPWAVGSGLLWAVGLSLFFYALRREEVSRAAPVQSLSPVFAAVIAVCFLGEALNAAQWIAILVVVLGTALISIRPENGRVQFARRRVSGILVVSAFAIALAFIFSEEATRRMNIWAIQAFRALAMGSGVLLISWRPSVTPALLRALRSPRAIGVMLLAEGLLAPIAALSFVAALDLGPVSLVSAVIAIRPLAILAISLGLSTPLWNVLHEPLDRQTLGLKAIATALIVGGVVTLGVA